MKHYGKLIILALIFHLFLLASTQFTAWPEMLFWPYLLLRDWLPYRDIAIAHSPLLVVVLTTFYKIFGIGIWQQKIISWLITIATDLIFIIIARKVVGQAKSLVALFFFILFQVYFEGNGIWFDHTLVVFALLIYYFLQQKNYYLVGIFWALAFFTKQTSFWFLFPIGFELVKSRTKIKSVIDMILGTFPIVLVFVLSIIVLGIQKDYLNWSVLFGISKLPSNTFQIKWPTFAQLLFSFFPFVVFLPLLINSYKKYVLLFIWSIAGLISAFPRFELFHFQPALSFVSLAFSFLISNLFTRKTTWVWLLIPFLTFVIVGRGLLCKFDKPDRFITTNDNMIVEIVKKKTQPGQTIFVTNYWDNVYALTDTIPANRPFIPQLSQYVTQSGIEDNILKDLRNNFPVVVVRGREGLEVLNTSGFEKINNFIDNNYRVDQTIGEVDILVKKQ